MISLLQRPKKLNSKNWIILAITNLFYLLILAGLGFALYAIIFGEYLKVIIIKCPFFIEKISMNSKLTFILHIESQHIGME